MIAASDSFIPANNYVLFAPDWDSDQVRIAGFTMYVNPIFEKGMHAPVGGEVMAVPRSLLYTEDYPALDFDVPMEVQCGDFITVEFHEVFSAIENSEQRRVIYKDKECILVRYDRIIGAVRDGIIIPLNGYIFAQPLPYDPTSEFEIVEMKKKQHHGNKALVAHVGVKVKRYWWNREITDTLDVSVGDTIYFINHADVVVEHEYHRKMFENPMFRIHRKHIIGIK